jgi:hypothetical protein
MFQITASAAMSGMHMIVGARCGSFGRFPELGSDRADECCLILPNKRLIQRGSIETAIES